MDQQFRGDIEAIGRIDAVPTILDVVCRTTGMGFAAVARVTDTRWITCQSLDHLDFGLKPGDELEVESTFCHQIERNREPVVINHATSDPDYCNHPTPRRYQFESYIAIPIIRANGSFFGTLCALDPKPAKLDSPETIGMLKLFAELIAAQLDADDRLALAEANLVDERRVAQLREQFIAVLGHDLRNPVASIDSGLKMIMREPLNERAQYIATLIDGSVLRMRGLIDNILDFARGRLGDGITLQQTVDDGLETTLRQVIEELQMAHPDQAIEVHVDLEKPVRCDPLRISQLLSNLLGNAVTHGAAGGVISVGITTSRNRFRIEVANSGKPMSDHAMKNIFQPFSRGEGSNPQQGLGLGLFISSEIAKAHGGALNAVSDDAGTRITFEMPLAG